MTPIDNNLISKYLKYMVNIKSSSPHTERSYKKDLLQTFPNAMIFEHFSELISHIRRAQTSWSHLSLATRNRKTAVLKSFFNWLYAEGLMEKEVAPLIHCPKVPQKIPHFISPDEAIAVLKSYPTELNRTEVQDKALFCLLYGAGLRVSEACNLEWKNVELSERRLLVTRKGQKDQWVPMPQLTADVLLKLKKENGDFDFIFGEKALHTRTAYEIVRQRGKKAALMKPLHPHALRHSFATHLLTSGADLRTLQELLGHHSLAATQKYTHISTHELARTMESFHPLSGGKKKVG